MPTVTLTAKGPLDQGHLRSSVFETSVGYIQLGPSGPVGIMGIRWTGIKIPTGSTITSATFTGTYHGGDGGVLAGSLKGILEPATQVPGTDWDTRPKTMASTAAFPDTFAYTPGVSQVVLDVTSIFAEVFAQSKFAGVFALVGVAGATNSLFWKNYAAGLGGPTLEVVYTLPVGYTSGSDGRGVKLSSRLAVAAGSNGFGGQTNLLIKGGRSPIASILNRFLFGVPVTLSTYVFRGSQTRAQVYKGARSDAQIYKGSGTFFAP